MRRLQHARGEPVKIDENDFAWYRRRMYAATILGHRPAGDANMPAPPNASGLVLGFTLIAVTGGMFYWLVRQPTRR